jgi:hypothetical protein
MNGNETAGGFIGLGSGQGLAVVLTMLLPAAISLFLWVARRRASHGGRTAARFLNEVERSSLTARVAVVLLLIAAAIHLGLAPAHGQQRPGLGLLFVVDAVAFVAVATAAFLVSWWRRAAAALLIGTIVAYLIVLGSGSEAPDQAGLATKLVELTALGLILLPHRVASGRWRRRLRWVALSGAVLFFGTTTGAVAWGASLQHHDETEAHDHPLGPATPPHAHPETVHRHGPPVPGVTRRIQPSGPPSAEERVAAAKLVEDTWANIAKYQDEQIARADGYRATALGGALVHYENKRYTKDDAVLDPARPEQLVYVHGPNGPTLVGVVYVMPRAGMAGPNIGGSLTNWHTHSLCLGPVPPFISGLVTPFGSCMAGAINAILPEMMHVWTIDNPGGPFAEHLDPAMVQRLQGR